MAFTIGQSFINENQMRRSPQSFGNTYQKESLIQNLEIFNKLYPVSLRPVDDYKLTQISTDNHLTFLQTANRVLEELLKEDAAAC